MSQEQGSNAAAPSIFTEQVAEQVPCDRRRHRQQLRTLLHHYEQKRKLGVSDLDMRYALDLAQKVKDTPARAMLNLAERYLGLNAGHQGLGQSLLCSIPEVFK